MLNASELLVPIILFYASIIGLLFLIIKKRFFFFEIFIIYLHMA